MPESGVKSRKISILKEFKRYDKSFVRVPRQELPFLLNFLILCVFLNGRREFYNEFTTFRKMFRYDYYTVYERLIKGSVMRLFV